MNSILTKEYIEKLGYEVEEVGHRIFLIFDFIKKEEIDIILNQISISTEDDWTTHYMEGVIQLAKLKFGRTDIDNLVKEGLYEITYNWHDKNLKIADLELTKELDRRAQEVFNFRDDLSFNGCGTVQRQYEGVELKSHVDNHTDNSLEYAAVFYLNDEYTNGEVFFVDQKIELRPPVGSLLVFPATDGWEHGVKPPGPGPHRYIIPTFISRKNFWEINEENGYNIDKTLSDTNFKE